MDSLELGKRRAEELGLQLHLSPLIDNGYRADEIHHLLGGAKEVFDAKSADGKKYNGTWFEHGTHTSDNTALLIGIRPIVRESDERLLLHEIIEEMKTWSNRSPDKLGLLIIKAKRLLENK